MENLLFNIRPDLKEKVDEVKVKKFKCSSCGEMTLDGWEYRIGEVVECLTAAQMCNGCGTKELSRQVSQELHQKRVDMLIANWWYIPDKETAGFKNYNSVSKCTDDAKQKSIAYTKAFSKENMTEKNLLIMGSTGSGKSHLSKAIARTLRAKNFTVGYIPAVELFKKIKATFDKDNTDRLYEELKKRSIIVRRMGDYLRITAGTKRENDALLQAFAEIIAVEI
jgi:DNA replication protein DnaC